jgi:pimeloyl-ACP methyl ester carboxylesterase
MKKALLLSIIITSAIYGATAANAATYFDFRSNTGIVISNSVPALCPQGGNCKYIVIPLGHPSSTISGFKYYRFNPAGLNIMGGGCSSGALDIDVYNDAAYTSFRNAVSLARSGTSPVAISSDVNFDVPASSYAQLIFGCNDPGNTPLASIDGSGGTYSPRDRDSIFYSGLPNLCIGDTPQDCGGIPSSITSIQQFNSDGVTPISEGSVIAEANPVFTATLQVPDSGTAALQIELEPSFIPFRNVPTMTSNFVSSGATLSVSAPPLAPGGYHWQARAIDAQGNASPWQSMTNPAATEDFAVLDSGLNIVLRDGTTLYGISTQPNPCVGDGTVFSCPLTPELQHYIVGSSFPISKIAFNWRNTGGNNCNGIGSYGAIITFASTTNSIIATSSDAAYLACAGFSGGTQGTASVDFNGQTVPTNFYLSFGAFDGVVQGGANITVSNVTIYSSQQREPVMIIPGIFGSASKDGQLVLDPLLGTYNSLESTLVANGYVKGQTLFDFPYDWEHTNILVIAHQLANQIQQIKVICDCSKINLVAHSMGGLVARQYIESDLYQNDVDQLIFLGTPHLGAPAAYFAWEGGTNQISSLTDIGMRIILQLEAVEAGFGFTPLSPGLQLYNYIHSSSSLVFAFQELLPTYDYLRDVSNSALRSYPNGYPDNSLLDGLNSPSSLLILQQSGVKITNMYSNEQMDTSNIIDVKNDNSFAPLWADGIPQGFESDTGDGTVPVSSATAVSASNTIQVGGTHSALPTTAQAQIVQLLTGNGDVVTANSPIIKNFLFIGPLSPVHILVTAPDGSRIGKDFSTGQEVNQINGAFYSGFNGPNEYVFIPSPEDGQYTIATQGTATAPYHVFASYGYQTSSSATSSDLIFAGNTQPGFIENLNLTVNSSTPTANTIAPQDTTPPVISHSILNSQYLLNATAAQFTYSAVDSGVGVFSETSTLDGIPLASGASINFNVPGNHAIVITAQDFVGNTTSTTIGYNVIYDFGGFLPPIKADGSGVYNLGRTLPIKFQLKDANGNFVSNARAKLVVTNLQNGIVGTNTVDLATSTTDTGNLFRYDSTANQYIYNFDSGQLTTGTWQLKVVLDDGNSDAVIVSLK